MWNCAEFGYLQSADLCGIATYAECGPMQTYADWGSVQSGDLCRLGTCAEWERAESENDQSVDVGRVGTCAESIQLCISHM